MRQICQSINKFKNPDFFLPLLISTTTSLLDYFWDMFLICQGRILVPLKLFMANSVYTSSGLKYC